MMGQLTANEMFVVIVGAILSFALQMLSGWILWNMKQNEKSREAKVEEIVNANKALRAELAKLEGKHLDLQTEHDAVVLYLKMKNGDIAREVL